MKFNFDEIIDRGNTNCYKYDLRRDIFGTSDVIPMWVADMDFKIPPFVTDALRKRMEHEILGYSFIPPSFYESAAEWIKRRHSWKTDPAEMCFSPGVVPALNMIVLTYTKPGDGIIVQPPVYFPFFTAIKNHDRVMITNPLVEENGEYKMDFDDLVSKIDSKTRMIFLCNPHNPTGNIWPLNTLERLAEICMKNNILIVSDEIHSDLIYHNYKHIPMAGLSEDVARNTITCMAPSKTFNLAGLSTSFLIIPDKELRKQYNVMLDKIHTGAGNIFGFIASEAAYKQGDEWLSQLMSYIDDNFQYMNDFINKRIPIIKVIKPQSTTMVWLNCSKMGLDRKELNKFMINEAGLGLSDGELFGIEGRGFQRINIACPRLILAEAMEKLELSVNKIFNAY